MKKFISILLLAFVMLSSSAQNPTLQWAKSIGSSGGGDDVGKILKIDGSGNTYLAGIYVGTIDFDPSAAVSNMSSTGNS